MLTTDRGALRLREDKQPTIRRARVLKPVNTKQETLNAAPVAALAPTTANLSGSDNPNPNPIVGAVPPALAPSQQVVNVVTPQFLTDLRALLTQIDTLVAALPGIDAADRRSFRLQASADEGFKKSLVGIIAQRAGGSLFGVSADVVGGLATAEGALRAEVSHLLAILTRVDDSATIARRDLVLHLRVAKSTFDVVSARSGSDLKAEMAQVGSRFTGTRKRKAMSPPASSGAPVAPAPPTAPAPPAAPAAPHPAAE